MEWTIGEVARMSGTTSRALRHYDFIGLVSPSRTGRNGLRYYDQAALMRLQRVLLLRELGLSLACIAATLDDATDNVEALRAHLQKLRAERRRLAKQVAAVEYTIATLEQGGTLMAEEMFAGFDHSEHQAEVEERWGKETYAKSDRWWRGLGPDGRARWQSEAEQLSADWIAAAGDVHVGHDSPEAQELAARHIEWLRSIPGTPAAEREGDLDGYVRGLAEMYVADERFAANYGGVQGAEFVRDALLAYLDGTTPST